LLKAHTASSFVLEGSVKAVGYETLYGITSHLGALVTFTTFRTSETHIGWCCLEVAVPNISPF